MRKNTYKSVKTVISTVLCLSALLLSSCGNGKAPLPLGYIPCGSTNDFAETLQIYLKPHIAAMQIVEGKPHELDIGQFGEKRYFTYIASFGAFTSASYNASQDMKNTLGHFAYLLAGLSDLSSLRGHKVKVTANGKTYNGNYVFGSVSNTTSVAGLVKFKDTIVDLSDGKFEVILVKKPADILDLNKIITGIANSDFSSDAFDYFKADTIEFEMGKSVPWTLDGEKADAPGDVTIRNLNKALTLIR